MIYEFIATISAGFAMAGLALIIRHLSKLTGRQAPKWLVPVFVGLGMLGFQIHQEYHWYEQTVNRLPDNVTVIKTMESIAWYKPWSYVKPQISKLMAIDGNNIITSDIDPNLKRVDLYLFERRMSSQRRTQIINCATAQRADFIKDADNTNVTDINNGNALTGNKLTWYPLDQNDPIILIACQ